MILLKGLRATPSSEGVGAFKTAIASGPLIPPCGVFYSRRPDNAEHDRGEFRAQKNRAIGRSNRAMEGLLKTRADSTE
jgi:hypothetical protein